MMALCRKHNIYPAFRIPYYKTRMRAMVKAHISKYHPQYEVR